MSDHSTPLSFDKRTAINYFLEVQDNLGNEAYWVERAAGEGFDESQRWTGLSIWESCEASHSDNSIDTLTDNGITMEQAERLGRQSEDF